MNRTLFLLAGHLVVLSVHGLAIAAGELREFCRSGPPLYDVWHALIARGTPWAVAFTRLEPNWVIAAGTLALIVTLLRLHDRELLFRRFLVFHSSMSLIRLSSIWVTTVPGTNPSCAGRVMSSDQLGERALTLTVDAIGIDHRWLGLGADGVTCCDTLVSGHTSMLMITAGLLLMSYRHRVIRGIVWGVTAVALVATASPGRHYTVDVVLTAVIAALLLALYRQWTRGPSPAFVHWIEQVERFPHGVRPMGRT